MTRDEVIRLAREAGLPPHIVEAGADRELARFAALVAAAEREACAKVCDGIDEVCFPTSRGPAAKCAQAIRARGSA